MSLSARSAIASLFFGFLPAGAIHAQTCPTEPPLQNFQGAGQVLCPCFAPGEEAGVVLNAPAGHYPLQILKVGIGWASYFGGNPAQVEEAIHVYGAGLPNPGSRVYSLDGPLLTDGFINEYNVEGLNWTRASGPFTVTLEFMNPSSTFTPAPVHDGNGCNSGKNVVKTIGPTVWHDACALGVSGDWIFYVIYRKTNCPSTGADETAFAMSAPAFLLPPSPNPFRSRTQVAFLLDEPADAEVSVFDVAGRRLATLAEGAFGEGEHRVDWDGSGPDGSRVPSGVYFVRLEAAGLVSTQKVFMER